MALELLKQVIEYQMALFSSSYSNAVIGVVALDFLSGYAILTAGGQRRISKLEFLIVTILLVTTIWAVLNLIG